MKQTCYTLYGLLVDPGELTLEDLERIGQVRNDGRVGYFEAGAHDREMTFLALTCREVELGDYVMHPGDRPHASEADRAKWNEALRRAAAKTRMRVLDGPGWFTVPDEY